MSKLHLLVSLVTGTFLLHIQDEDDTGVLTAARLCHLEYERRSLIAKHRCACPAGAGQPKGQPEGWAATTEQEAASEMEGVRLRRWAVGSPLPMDEDWQPAPGKWALSEREMGQIDLGGAEP